MELRLSNFHQQLDPQILARGQRYFADGAVTGLVELEPGHWQALVHGSETYTVDLVASNEGDLLGSCDCPYEWGPICKHVAAVLLALEANHQADALSRQTVPGQLSRKEQLAQLLARLGREELLDLLLDQALRDRQLAHQLLSRYAPQLEDRAALAELITEALQLGRGRHGYIDYRGALDAARGVGRVLARATRHRDNGQPAAAIQIYQAVLEQTVPALNQADDSMGALGGVVAETLAGLEATADELEPAGRAELFTYYLEIMRSDLLGGWDWHWQMAALASALAVTAAQEQRYFATLDVMAERRQDRWGAAYDQTRAARLKLERIEAQGDEAVEAFLTAHLHLDDMRLELAQRQLDRQEWAAVRALCQGWFAESRINRHGVRRQFLDLLAEVAAGEGDRPEQIRLTEQLYLETGEANYYERLKALVTPSRWSAYQPGFISRAEEAGGRLNIADLYAAESLWPALLAQVQQNPALAVRYHNVLAPRFPLELGVVYAQLAERCLQGNPDRSSYQEACHLLKRRQGMGQAAEVAAQVARWRQEDRRRRALLDELNKAFGPEP